MSFNRLVVPDRARHACCVFGHYMLIHGGVDIDEVPMNDIKILNLSKVE